MKNCTYIYLPLNFAKNISKANKATKENDKYIATLEKTIDETGYSNSQFLHKVCEKTEIINKKASDNYKNKKYNVYKIFSQCPYHGSSLVAANSAIEANKIIRDFMIKDKDNRFDSIGYSMVDESDRIEFLYSDKIGIIDHGIYY